MSGDVEWGPWMVHDGKGCPLPLGTLVNVTWEARPGHIGTSTGQTGPNDAAHWEWSFWGKPDPNNPTYLVARIIRYRIRRPRAVDDLVRLAAEPYAPPPVIGPDSPVRQPEEVVA